MKYTWEISAVNCILKQNGLDNVIKEIHWRYKGENEDGVNAEVYGCELMSDPDPANFLTLDQITKTVAAGWLESIFSIEVDGKSRLNGYKEFLEDQINLIINPINVILQLND